MTLPSPVSFKDRTDAFGSRLVYRNRNCSIAVLGCDGSWFFLIQDQSRELREIIAMGSINWTWLIIGLVLGYFGMLWYQKRSV
jgi:hypothetical protein